MTLGTIVKSVILSKEVIITVIMTYNEWHINMLSKIRY